MLDLMKNDKLEVRTQRHLDYIKAQDSKKVVAEKVKADNTKAIKDLGKKDASQIRGMLVR